MIRPELRAAFDRDENRDHVCSCLACVESRRPGPVVVFTEDDIEWNQKIEAELCIPWKMLFVCGVTLVIHAALAMWCQGVIG